MTSKKCGDKVVDSITAMLAMAQSLRNIEQYYYGMPDLANIRSYEAIRVTLRDTAMAAEKGVVGMVWTAPETWNPFRVDSGAGVDFPLKRKELDMIRQWFDSLQDVNPQYLRRADYKLAVRIYEQLGARVTNALKKGAGLNPPNPSGQATAHGQG